MATVAFSSRFIHTESRGGTLGKRSTFPASSPYLLAQISARPLGNPKKSSLPIGGKRGTRSQSAVEKPTEALEP